VGDKIEPNIPKSVQKPKLLVITGPTAVGKSAVAVQLARAFGAEIISADSMQIYRGMDIGTGKISPGEAMGVPHHLIDIVAPDAPYSVGNFITDARAIIGQLYAQGKSIIVSGGTGLYINALVNGYNLAGAGHSEAVRARCREKAAREGNGALYAELAARDSESAAKISPNDQKRLIRALEILELTGEAKSARAKASGSGREFDVLTIVLACEREKLYDKINRRVDSMLGNGLEREVERLLPYRDCQSMQAIGYKEFVGYFDGRASYAQTVGAVKQHSRNYAKRQMTFFRSMPAGVRNEELGVRSEELGVRGQFQNAFGGKLCIDAEDGQAVFDAVKRFFAK